LVCETRGEEENEKKANNDIGKKLASNIHRMHIEDGGEGAVMVTSGRFKVQTLWRLSSRLPFASEG